MYGHPGADPSDASPDVFFEVEIGGREAGRIEIQLYDDVVPKTAQNFRKLCLGK